MGTASPVRIQQPGSLQTGKGWAPSVRSWEPPGCPFPAYVAIKARPHRSQTSSSLVGLDTLQNTQETHLAPSWAPHHGPALGCVPPSSGASCSLGQKSCVLCELQFQALVFPLLSLSSVELNFPSEVPSAEQRRKVDVVGERDSQAQTDGSGPRCPEELDTVGLPSPRLLSAHTGSSQKCSGQVPSQSPFTLPFQRLGTLAFHGQSISSFYFVKIGTGCVDCKDDPLNPRRMTALQLCFGNMDV